MTLGERLREARENKGWNQVYVAKVLDITSQTISGYERGIRDPDTSTLKRLAQLYEVSIDYLLGFDIAEEIITNSNTATIGSRLKALRENKGVYQKDVAKYLGITTSAYGYYEQEQRRIESDILIKLADYFEVSADFLLGRTDATTSNKYGVVATNGLPQMVCENKPDYNKSTKIIDHEPQKSANKIVKIEIDSSKNPSKKEILTSLEEGLRELAEEGHLTAVQVTNIIELMTKKIENNEL